MEICNTSWWMVIFVTSFMFDGRFISKALLIGSKFRRRLLPKITVCRFKYMKFFALHSDVRYWPYPISLLCAQIISTLELWWLLLIIRWTNHSRCSFLITLHIVSTFLVYLHFPKMGRRLREETEIKQVAVGWRTFSCWCLYIHRRKRVATLPRCCIYAGRCVSLARCSLKVVDSYRTADEAKVKSDSKRTERESLFPPSLLYVWNLSRASETIHTSS